MDDLGLVPFPSEDSELLPLKQISENNYKFIKRKPFEQTNKKKKRNCRILTLLKGISASDRMLFLQQWTCLELA